MSEENDMNDNIYKRWINHIEILSLIAERTKRRNMIVSILNRGIRRKIRKEKGLKNIRKKIRKRNIIKIKIRV